MSYIPACSANDLQEGSKKSVVIAGRKICIYRLSDGYFATADECTHSQSSLSDGFIEDDWIVQCPRHGARYNIRTGGVQSLPATAGLRTFPVRVEQDTIYIDINENAS